MIIPFSLRPLIAAGLVLSTMGLGGCGADEEPGGAAAQSTGAGADASLLAGTPEGGLERWVGEIRAGVDSLPALAARDASAAKNIALNLYVARQEYIELYYGTTARAVSDAELNEAVMTAEARFHDLLRVVNTPDGAIDTAALREAGAALGAEYDRVMARARVLGVDLTRPVAVGGSR
ncbi:MAG TPA: hypothetical protein VK939_09810 [Longimicrobiales bacterium]|nr:hypothetical protein [Longimicrobiales bacterium]